MCLPVARIPKVPHNPPLVFPLQCIKICLGHSNVYSPVFTTLFARSILCLTSETMQHQRCKILSVCSPRVNSLCNESSVYNVRKKNKQNGIHCGYRKVGATLESMDSWMVSCEPLPASNFYMRLTSGIRVLDNKLCTQSEYQLGN